MNVGNLTPKLSLSASSRVEHADQLFSTQFERYVLDYSATLEGCGTLQGAVPISR